MACKWLGIWGRDDTPRLLSGTESKTPSGVHGLWELTAQILMVQSSFQAGFKAFGPPEDARGGQPAGSHCAFILLNLGHRWVCVGPSLPVY